MGRDDILKGSLLQRPDQAGKNLRSNLKISDNLKPSLEVPDPYSKPTNLMLEGYLARIYNHENGQDAYSISPDLIKFAVADGVGGSAGRRYENVTAHFANLLTQKTVNLKVSISHLLDPKYLLKFLDELKKSLQENYSIETSAIRGTIKIGIFSTLTVAERIGQRKFQLLCLGDSPAFVLDPSGKIVKQLGQDSNGTTDIPLEDAIGFDFTGQIILPKYKRIKRIYYGEVELPPGYMLAIGTDYFSDHATQSKDLGMFLTASPEEFDSMVTGPDRAKGDDATLIVINPDKLPKFHL